MNKTWYEEVEEKFRDNIKDNETLIIALEVLEDRKELLNKNLELQNKAYEDGILDSIKEVQRLDKIIKELRSWLEEYKENASNSLDSYDTGIADCLEDVIRKLNELEGDK